MSRKVFFSFDLEADAGRADQIRRSAAIDERDMEGFFTHAELGDAGRQGGVELKQLILGHLRNTSVTVVLIGAKTASHPWVKYEIYQSIEQMNGLLGVYIGHLKDDTGRTPAQGLKPMVPAGIAFPAYSWDGDRDRFMREIMAAGMRSDAMRARGSVPGKPGPVLLAPRGSRQGW
ncbi:MAG TPA: TIR domain-containing protein [Candidatus Polarisedimenticolia bacterium]|nr:TIR domain-containing protein [Candidatus Polarisedimenticolia bacterium]